MAQPREANKAPAIPAVVLAAMRGHSSAGFAWTSPASTTPGLQNAFAGVEPGRETAERQSAFKLADYFLVRHGSYDVASLFTPRASTDGSPGAASSPTWPAWPEKCPHVTARLHRPLVKPGSGANIS